MKPTLIVAKAMLALALFAFKANAQFSVDTSIEDLYKLNIFNPGISLEKRIFKYNTVQLNVYWNATINSVKNNEQNTKQYTVFFDPTLNIQYRNYYNYYKRADIGRNVNNNGANFIGGIIERTVTRLPISNTIFAETARPVIKLGAIYGLQRTLFDFVLVEAYMGVGYQWETKNLEVSDGQTQNHLNSAIGVFGRLNIGIPVL